MSAISAAGEQYYREQALLTVLPEWALARAREIVGKTPDRLRDFKCYVATSTMIALALAAAAAGTSYYNTQKTAKNADNALATQIRNQGSKQKEADAKVNEEVAKMKASRSDDERQKALTGYLDTLRGSKAQLEKGLTPDFGSAAFQADSAKAAQGVEQFGADRAGLMSRVDASLDQRRGEGYDYGRLGTDLGLIGREARGQDFLDQLAVQKASRRNAGLDALSAFLGGAAGGVSGMSAGAAGAGSSAGNGLYGMGFRGLGSIGY